MDQEKDLNTRHQRKSTTAGIEASLLFKDIEAKFRREYPSMKIIGWNENGLLVKVEFSTLESSHYKGEIFHRSKKDNLIIAMKNKCWTVNLQ